MTTGDIIVTVARSLKRGSFVLFMYYFLLVFRNIVIGLLMFGQQKEH
jgi:hypothetical protein